jgi:hypothetical protein
MFVWGFSLSQFRNIVDRFVWAFAGVYGLNSDIDKSLHWDELAGILSWWSLPWCIGGDFNVARFPSERSGEGCRSALRDFFDFSLSRVSWTFLSLGVLLPGHALLIPLFGLGLIVF